VIVGDLGERKLIERIRELAGLYSRTSISRDDAAVLDLSNPRVVLTTDRVPADLLSLRAGLMTMEDLGRYVVEVNISDLVAMAARPAGFLLNLAMPANLPLEDLKR
jgi:thiamine monophosphate kinase